MLGHKPDFWFWKLRRMGDWSCLWTQWGWAGLCYASAAIDSNRLPESIIQYVIRTHESVILNDATREGNFINEPYIQHHQTQSLLCLPLLNQDKLVGVLSLENQVATGAFTLAHKFWIYYRLRRRLPSKMPNFIQSSAPAESDVSISRSGSGGVQHVDRPHYFNQRAIQLVGKGLILPHTGATWGLSTLSGGKINNIHWRTAIIRALSGERTTVDDLEIHKRNSVGRGTPIFDEAMSLMRWQPFKTSLSGDKQNNC